MCLHKTVNNVRIVIKSAPYGYTMYSSEVYKMLSLCSVWLYNIMYRSELCILKIIEFYPPGEVPYTVYTPDILPYRRDENRLQAASEPL